MVGASTLCAASPKNCCTNTDWAFTRRKGRNKREGIKLLRLNVPGNARDCAHSFNWGTALLISQSRGESDL